MKYTTSFIVFPKHCNHHKELIFGGAFMAELDLAAAHCVRKMLKGNPSGIVNAVTHKADFDFMKPTYVNDVLDLEASITTYRNKSLTVIVTAKRDDALIAVGNFVFITIDKIESLEHHPEFLPYRDHLLKPIDKDAQ